MKQGEWVEVEVFKITSFGAFVKMPNRQKGLIHISQVSDDFVKDINDHLKVGDRLKAKIINIGRDGKIDLTLRNEPNRRKVKLTEDNKDKKDSFRILPFENQIDELLERNRTQLEPAESPN